MRRIAMLAAAVLGLGMLAGNAQGAEKLDARLVGVWRYTYTYTSGTFTIAEDQYLALAADGSVAIGFKRAGGTAVAGATTGKVKITNVGTWHAEGKVLKLKWKAGAPEAIPFIYGESFGKTKMLFKGGGKKMWTKIR